MAKLRIKLEDCSPLGKLLLQYMEENNISMNELAKQAGISQPGLRSACLKRSNPTDATLNKLSKVLGKHPLELYTLAYEGRIEELQDEASDNYLDSLMRELFETARELGLVPPKSKPPKINIKRALKELGFGSDEQGL